MSTIDDFAEMLRDSITKKTFVLNQNGIMPLYHWHQLGDGKCHTVEVMLCFR